MRQIVIGFSTPKKFHLSSQIIKCFEGSEFSHIFLRLPAKKGSVLDFDKVFQASRGDVNAMKYFNFLKENHIFHEYYLEVSDESYYKIASFLWGQLGKPYSIAQLINIAINREIFKNRESAYICSELAGVVLRDFLGYSLHESQDKTGLNDIKKILDEVRNDIS